MTRAVSRRRKSDTEPWRVRAQIGIGMMVAVALIIITIMIEHAHHIKIH